MDNLKHIGLVLGIVLLIIGNAMIFGKKHTPNSLASTNTITTQNAYFAGGCFWCMEGIFESQEGVIEAISGYIGGSQETANYKDVSSGQTSHREGVKIVYDPEKISYKKLVELFWTQIDPTDEGGQFADRGFHYTTAIYYDGEQEEKIAFESKENLEKSGKFESDIATKILSIVPFFPAENYHQDYYKKSATRYQNYARLSGRKGFIEENWKEKIAQLNETTYSDEELRKRLTPLQYKVTQEDGTEKPFNNAYWDNKEDGIYVDIIDGTPLYSSLDKYDSGTGWPSFTKAISESVIDTETDTKFFMIRTEAVSASSDAHLGHIFPDGPEDAGGMRHCINSAALKFISVDELEDEGYGEYLKLFNGTPSS